MTLRERLRGMVWRLLGNPPMADPPAAGGEAPLLTGVDSYASFGDWNPWSRYNNPIAAFFDFYQQNPWVRGVCDKIAGEVLVDGWQMADTTGQTRAHPQTTQLEDWLKAIRYGSKRFTAALDLAVCHNAFFFIQENGLGQVTNLIRIAPQTMKPIGDVERGIVAWKQTVGNKSRVFPAEKILHLKGPNPVSDLIGLPILTAAAIDVEADDAMAMFNRAYFGNGTQAGTILTWDQGDLRNPKSGEWDERDEKKATNLWAQMTSYIERRFQNPTSAHLPLLLRGKWQVHGSGQAKADAQFLDGRRFNARIVCALYGFPIEALGLGDRGALGGNLAEPASEQLAACVAKFEGLIDEGFRDEFFVKRLGIVGLETAPRPRTAKITVGATVAALNLARIGKYTGNEIRAVTKHPPLPTGGDELYQLIAKPETTPPPERPDA